MRIPDEIRECVAFLCVRDQQDKVRFAGTAFFVILPSDALPDKGFVYLVTAKHTIAGLQARGHTAVYLRLNTTTGGVKLVEISLEDWVFHEEPSGDVAVIALAPPTDCDHRPFSLRSAATEDVIKEHKIGIGDEVFVVGLFVSHVGQQRNIPIVRIGTIAAMPEEPIDTQMGPMEAYLLEMRSIGGLSGSPAFVYLDPFRHPDTGVFWLLGLVHGHWSLPPKAATTIEEDLEKERINMGIAIVPPVARITEALDAPGLTKRRQELEGRGRNS